MNPLEMQKAFQRSISAQDIPFPSEDVFSWLNKAQIAYVNEKYSQRSSQDPQYFEGNPKITEELRPLIVRAEPVDAFAGEDTVKGFAQEYAENPDDLMYSISHGAVVHKGGSVSTSGDPAKREVSGNYEEIRANVRISHLDDVHRMLYDPFNTTFSWEPLGYLTDNRIYIATDSGFIVDKVLFTYLRYPKDIVYSKSEGNSQTCELPVMAHEDIVDLAVTLFARSQPSTDSQEQTT